MALTQVDEFTRAGRRFRLYEGDSWLLFEEHELYSEGIGTIHKTDTGYAVTAWSKPSVMFLTWSLDEAIEGRASIKLPTWPGEDQAGLHPHDRAPRRRP